MPFTADRGQNAGAGAQTKMSLLVFADRVSYSNNGHSVSQGDDAGEPANHSAGSFTPLPFYTAHMCDATISDQT